MNIVLKWMMLLIFSLSILPYAHAYNESKKNTQASDDPLISNWADSALNFKALDKDYDLEALGFVLSNENINALNPPILNQSANHQIDVLFDNKSFSAQTGFSNQTINQINQQTFFIQGSYKVLQQEKFSLVVTAKIESLNDHSIYQFYSNDFVSTQVITSKVIGTKSYARFGILGQYSINEQWSLTGGLTSTALENSANSEQASSLKQEQVALFGTTYTF